MDAHDSPNQDLRPLSAREAQLQAWNELHDRMKQLHAELEFLRLMLKLRPEQG